jgi:DNA gyrase subunit A
VLTAPLPWLEIDLDQSTGLKLDQIAHNLLSIDIEQEMRSSYLDYSMSVIIGRALPDVRDGLKPVHRRILYAMFREGLLSNRRYSKCAGVVGEVLKKYHPHGDSAVYDSLVRMAQPWNMRAPLVDGQGNFGSVDGDPAAAYRYTECKMTKVAEELLSDIDKDTVNFHPNFDGSTEEPTVLPAAFPNLLVNGSDGIAVGMATKIPPHNLREIINGVIALSENPEISLDELMQIIPGPDFPTAGHIYGRGGVRDAYETGRGRVVMRGNAIIEDMETGGKERIVIDELPFQVNKARLVTEIANLVKQKKVDGITALRDESDRRGMRVVVELRRDVVAEVVLNHLFKHTALQSTFGVILLSIVGNQPKVLTLKEMLHHYLHHRRDITLRRCRYQLRKAEQRKHLLEGYLIALDNLDEVIALIRGSATPDEARVGLVERFNLSVVQAQAILDMRLQRLTGMERQKILDEYAELEARIAELQAILGSEQKLMDLIREELTIVRDKYADDRRTRFVEASGDLSIEDLIAPEDQVITLSVNGYIKRASPSEYAEQRRGGKGRRGSRPRAEDSVKEIFLANTHSKLLIFTRRGQIFRVPVYQVPKAGLTARGLPVVNLVQLSTDEEVAAVLSIKDFDEPVDLIFCSRKGLIKRTALWRYKNLHRGGMRAYDCADGDELLTVVLSAHSEDYADTSEVTEGENEIFILTREGKCVRFHRNSQPNKEGDHEGAYQLGVRQMGRVARGVRGITLREGDEIACMEVLGQDPDLRLLTITEDGMGKRTSLDEYRVQNRGGMGIIDIKVGATARRKKATRVAGAILVHSDDLIMLITNKGQVIKCPVANIREVSRNTTGVRLMNVDKDEVVVSVARIVDESDEEGVEELDSDIAPDGAAEPEEDSVSEVAEIAEEDGDPEESGSED